MDTKMYNIEHHYIQHRYNNVQYRYNNVQYRYNSVQNRYNKVQYGTIMYNIEQ